MDGEPIRPYVQGLAAMGFSEVETTADPRSFDPLAPGSR